MNRQTDKVCYRADFQKDRYDQFYKKNHKTLIKISTFLKHEGQTDGPSKLCALCSFVHGIITQNISRLLIMTTKKITKFQ